MAKSNAVREPVRATEPETADTVRPKKMRTRKGGATDRLHVPKELIPVGMDYQWVTDSVLGQPDVQTRMNYEANGWEAVPASRHPGLFMPVGHTGEINVGGLVLMERPIELTMEAREEERQAARIPRQMQERAMLSGNIPGVTLETNHPSVKANTFINRTVEPGTIEVPKD